MGARYGYILSPSAMGARYGCILSPLSRLVPATGTFFLPFRDWCPRRVYPLSPFAIGARYGYILTLYTPDSCSTSQLENVHAEVANAAHALLRRNKVYSPTPPSMFCSVPLSRKQ
eukprot:4213138-Pyramimonas_sp.AAC.1